jgi:hypothetical protein
MSGAGRAFILTWGLSFLIVMVLAWRKVTLLMKIADERTPEARDLMARTTRWAYRYAFTVMALGALMALVAPWI